MNTYSEAATSQKQSLGEVLQKGVLFCQLFSCEVSETFKNFFSYRTSPVTASAPLVAASVFFKKNTIKQLFRNLVMTY